jgi:hypothetical protein
MKRKPIYKSSSQTHSWTMASIKLANFSHPLDCSSYVVKETMPDNHPLTC